MCFLYFFSFLVMACECDEVGGAVERELCGWWGVEGSSENWRLRFLETFFLRSSRNLNRPPFLAEGPSLLPSLCMWRSCSVFLLRNKRKGKKKNKQTDPLINHAYTTHQKTLLAFLETKTRQTNSDDSEVSHHSGMLLR